MRNFTQMPSAGQVCPVARLPSPGRRASTPRQTHSKAPALTCVLHAGPEWSRVANTAPCPAYASPGNAAAALRSRPPIREAPAGRASPGGKRLHPQGTQPRRDPPRPREGPRNPRPGAPARSPRTPGGAAAQARAAGHGFPRPGTPRPDGRNGADPCRPGRPRPRRAGASDATRGRPGHPPPGARSGKGAAETRAERRPERPRRRVLTSRAPAGSAGRTTSPGGSGAAATAVAGSGPGARTGAEEVAKGAGRRE